MRHYQAIGAGKQRCWVDGASPSKPDAIMAALREGLSRLEMPGDAGGQQRLKSLSPEARGTGRVFAEYL